MFLSPDVFLRFSPLPGRVRLDLEQLLPAPAREPLAPKEGPPMRGAVDPHEARVDGVETCFSHVGLRGDPVRRALKALLER
ncbi:hypothetical protein GCM10010103_68550 [Streptomyces paradoxus]